MIHSNTFYDIQYDYRDMFYISNKLFGTSKKAEPEQLTFGLEDFADDRKYKVWYMITAPFRKLN